MGAIGAMGFGTVGVQAEAVCGEDESFFFGYFVLAFFDFDIAKLLYLAAV